MIFYQFKRVLFQIIQEIIKDPKLEESYHTFCEIYRCTHSEEVFYNYLYFQFQLMIYENIAFQSKSKKIYWMRNISFIMMDLLGFINDIEKEYFINKINFLIEDVYEVIQNPYYDKRNIQSTKKYKRYIEYIFHHISKKINGTLESKFYQKGGNGSSTITILSKKECSLFNYYDNIHDFGKNQHISIDYHHYQLKSMNLPEMNTSHNIEKYFIHQIDSKYLFMIDHHSIHSIYNTIYEYTQKYKFVNDASGLLGIYAYISKGFRSEMYEKIYKKIREHKYIINTFANFLDAGNPYQELIENNNKTITSYSDFERIMESITIYNQCIKEICDDETYVKIEFDPTIQMNIYQKEKKIHTLLLYKNFNSIQTIVNHISMLNKKSKSVKYLLLRLKSMGDRIQAYEVYLTNRGLLHPILFDLKRGNIKEYHGSKRLFLATNDQMLSYFSCCGFDKMNLISRTSLHGKNYMILKNDF